MPTYDYRCAKCGDDIEVYQTFSEEPLKRHAGCGGRLTKVLSAVGIVLKGSGFYKTDNRESTAARKSREETSSNGESGSNGSESKATDSGGSESKSKETKSADSGSSSGDASKPNASGAEQNGAKQNDERKSGEKKSPVKSA